MADVKISALDAASTLAGTEVLPVVQSSTTKKATVAQVLAGVGPVNTVAAAGATETLDGDDYNVHDITLDENVEYTFTTSATVAQFTLVQRQDGSGTNTTTWPASVDWHAGTPPTMPTTASSVSILEFVTYDAGTRWFGALVGSSFA